MRKSRLYLAMAARLWIGVSALALPASAPRPGSEQLLPRQCLDKALPAMGGQERLRQLKTMRLDVIGHRLLAEQSYRQTPFLTAYERDRVTIDLAGQQVMTEAHVTWPESDPKQSEMDETTVAGSDGGVRRSREGDMPCSIGRLDAFKRNKEKCPPRARLPL